MSNNLNIDISKYSKDGAFEEPIVRCDSCHTMLFVEDIKKTGKCLCGCRKVRNVQTITSEEVKILKERDVDPAFLALFEEVADA